jgi:hypothetical protein
MTAKQLSPRTLQRLGNRAARDILIQAVEEIRGHGLPPHSIAKLLCIAAGEVLEAAESEKRPKRKAASLAWKAGYLQKHGEHYIYTAETEGGNYRLVPTNKPGTTTFSHYTVSFRSTGGNRKQISSAAANVEEAQAIAEHHHQHVG